jgi:hypothetical protein
VDAVALAATIGGSAVALAGVGVTAWGVGQQRASAKELAALQHGHERDLACGARLFERRAAAYEAMLGFLQVIWERILDTEPILRLAGTPAPPEPPSAEEWRAMYVRLRTFGSAPVARLYEEFTDATRDFFIQVDLFRSARDHPEQGALPWRELRDARNTVKEIYDRLEVLVSDELASL